MSSVKEQIKRLQQEIKDRRDAILWLRKNAKALSDVPDIEAFGTGSIDINRPSHAEVIKVVKALGGKWKKTPNLYAKPGETTFDYEQTIDGRRIRLWGGQPPPSCRMVEIEEEVPEQVIPAKVIPAHKIKVRKLVCRDHPDPLVVAMANAVPAQPSNPEPSNPQP